MANKFARFVARGDNDVIIGKNFGGLFKRGVVYHATEILGVITLQEVGLSASASSHMYGGSLADLDARSPEDLMGDGRHLLTAAEWAARNGVLND